MTDLPYPYDNPVSPTSPSFQGKQANSPSSFVITSPPPRERKWGKRILIALLFILILVSFGMIFLSTQEEEPVADIRNFATEEDIFVPPALEELGALFQGEEDTQIAADQEAPCAPGDSRSNCQTTTTDITAVVVTPTVIRVSSTPRPTAAASQFSGSTSVTSTPISTTAPLSTSTPTPIPLLSCQRVELYRGSENVTSLLSSIKHGDRIRFVGYVSDTGVPVKSLTFRLKIDDELYEVYEAVAVKSGASWIAQYDYTFTQYGKHRVTVIGVTTQ